MLNKSLITVALMLCPVAFAQGTFSGPGVLSRPTGGVGQRSGQDVDLRYYVVAAAIRDSGLTPYKIASDGALIVPDALNGVEAGVGAYGRHSFRRSSVGLDYNGNFRHYYNGSSYDGSNQQLNLDFNYQKSRRMAFQFNQAAGTQSFGAAFGDYVGNMGAVVDSSSLIFDNRTTYLQSAMTTQYAISGRTAISAGGNFYSIHRQTSALIGVNGYSLHGSINHQISRNNNIGIDYQHTHYDFPRAFGESDVNMYQGTWSAMFGRSWRLTLSGGILTAEVQGVQNTLLDPSIAALLGISSVQTIFYKENILPMGQVTVTRRFRRASWSGNYARTVTPGNGVFLTSRQESYGTGYAYTGFRKWSLSISAGYAKLDSIGQTIRGYSQLFANSNVGYLMGRGFNLTATYSRRRQDFDTRAFQRDSSRVSIGITFSPSSIPISFH